MSNKTNTKTTIIIPTKDRPLCLLRLIKFLENFSEEFKIIVLDSSEKKKNFYKINLKNNVEVKFFYFKSNISLAKKIFEGLKKVKTKYSVLCADDDFIIPSKFKLFKNFLENNSKYISVVGLSFNHPFRFQIKLSNLYFEEIYKDFHSNDSNSQYERIKNYFYGNAISSFYGYYKTTDLVKIYNYARFIKGKVLFEYFCNIFSLLFGKIKLMPTFFFSREPNLPIVYNKKFIDQNFSLNYINFSLKIIKYFHVEQRIVFLIKNYLLYRKKYIIEKKSNYIKKNMFNLKKTIFNFLSIFTTSKIKINSFKLIIHNKKLKIKTQDKKNLKKILEILLNSKGIEDEISIFRKKHFH